MLSQLVDIFCGTSRIDIKQVAVCKRCQMIMTATKET